MSEKSEQKTTSVKSTRMAKKVRPVVATMYKRAHEAKAAGKPVAYCMIASQYDEILLAMGITAVWTENYAGLCAVYRDAERFLVKAESEGYSNVICGYVRTGLGFDAMRKETGDIPPKAPDGGMPMPDILLGCSVGCDPRFKWYQALGHYMDTPMHAHDLMLPPIDADLKAVAPYYIEYTVEQLKGLIAFLEKQTGQKMDYDKLSHHLALSDETWKTWTAVDQLRKAIPCPMPSEDHFNIFVPGVFRMGEQETLDFYRELYQEVKERVDNKIGVIEDEKFRLMWAGGLPPWHTMWMFNHFHNMNAVFAIENAYRFCTPKPMSVGPENPLEYIAWRTFQVATTNYEKAMKNSGNATVETLLDLAADYNIDGMVMHSTKSCRATTIGQLHLVRKVRESMNIPSLNLISDIVDLRDYSESQWKMQIDAFMETVKARKAKH